MRLRNRNTFFGLLVCGVMACPVAAPAQVPPMPDESSADQKPLPRLVVEKRVHDLGEVVEGDVVTVTWTLENRGTADLVIERTKPSCGCTVVKSSDKDLVIPPGGKLDLTAEFDSARRRGEQHKFVRVESNDPADPKLSLEFTARIKQLYEMIPSGLLNLRLVQRGKPADHTLDVIPAEPDDRLEIENLAWAEKAPITYTVEPLKLRDAVGKRIRFTVTPAASLGSLKATLKMTLSIDGVKKERRVPIRAEVVGDVTVHPKLINAIRLPSPRGKRLAPVTLRSTNRTPFEILGVSAGPLLDASYEPDDRALPGTQYDVMVTIRDDAPAGPFGATLRVRTNSLDQPIVEVPVYGDVAELVTIEPPIILLRADGTPAGTKRRVKIQAQPLETLQITELTCDNQAVEARVDREASARYRHLRYIDVELRGNVADGTHKATLSVTTTVPGAERIEIPVSIDGGAGG